MKHLFAFAHHYQRVKSFHSRYERWLMPLALVAGFLIDYFTFTNVRINITLILLSIYWIAAGLAIACINICDAGKMPKAFGYIRLFAGLLMQFTFGALLGGSLVFYWFSGAISVSWPFIALIALLMLSNDVFRKYFSKLAVQIGVYFFITLSFFSLILPFIFNSISVWLFVAAGIMSLSVFYLYINFLAFARESVRQKKILLFALIIAVFAVMSLLYFTDIIPPIPLSIREAGAYHSIKRSNGKYVLSGEPETFWQRLAPGQTLHLAPGERAYLYTAVFAPAEFNTTILHHWQYYDEKQKNWVTLGKLPFSITGGQKEGYKGYSWISNPAPGKWRTYTQTQHGQTLGKIMITIKRAETLVALQNTIR